MLIVRFVLTLQPRSFVRRVFRGIAHLLLDEQSDGDKQEETEEDIRGNRTHSQDSCCSVCELKDRVRTTDECKENEYPPNPSLQKHLITLLLLLLFFERDPFRYFTPSRQPA